MDVKIEKKKEYAASSPASGLISPQARAQWPW